MRSGWIHSEEVRQVIGCFGPPVSFVLFAVMVPVYRKEDGGDRFFCLCLLRFTVVVRLWGMVVVWS